MLTAEDIAKIMQKQVACSVCSAFDAAFAQLLWLLSDHVSHLVFALR